MKKIAALLSALLAFSIFFTVPAYAQADASPNKPHAKLEKEQMSDKEYNYWKDNFDREPGETYKLTIYVKGKKKYSAYLDPRRLAELYGPGHFNDDTINPEATADFTDKETTNKVVEEFLKYQYFYSTDSMPEYYTYSLKKVK